MRKECVCGEWWRRREEGAKSHSLRRRRHPRFCAAQGVGEVVRRSSWKGVGQRPCRPGAGQEPWHHPLGPCCSCACTAGVSSSCGGAGRGGNQVLGVMSNQIKCTLRSTFSLNLCHYYKISSCVSLIYTIY